MNHTRNKKVIRLIRLRRRNLTTPKRPTVTKTELYEKVIEREEFENAGFASSCKQKHFKNGACKNDDFTIIVLFSCLRFFQTQIQTVT